MLAKFTRAAPSLLLALSLVAGCSADGTPQFTVNLRDGSSLQLMSASVAPVREPSAADGLRMYRDGIRPGGEPLTAIVSDDVPIEGTQFSCASCHGRSGMGAAEGAYIVPAIAGQFLFEDSPQPARPAYDAASLSRVLRDGVTPGGRRLSALMPRYALDDDEVASLGAYLAELSVRNSPGVGDRQIHFATVITDDVSGVDRDAVLSVLRLYFDEKNRQTRLESERWDRGYTPESRLPSVFREWVLEEWSLTGPRETWPAQLERYYAATPVFAMVSGATETSWRPVGEFCEANEMPCLFPGTDLPGSTGGDFYSFHFSGGLSLEAGLIARQLAASLTSEAVQLYCDHETVEPVVRLSALLSEQDVMTKAIPLDCTAPLELDRVAELLEGTKQSAAVLWLDRIRLAELDGLHFGGSVFLSSSKLNAKFDAPLPDLGNSTFIAHSLRLPGQSDPAFLRFTVWAKTRGIELLSPQRQSEAFFACLALKDAVNHIGRFFIRDYALDILDHAQGLAAYVPYHARPTFGPGQRNLNKGGYVLPILDGFPDNSAAEWVVP